MKKVFSFFLAIVVFVSVAFCSFGSVAVSDSNVYGLVISLATLAGFNFQPEVSNLTANQSWKNAIVFANNFLQSCYNSLDESHVAFVDELYTIAEELNTDVFQNKITVETSLLTRFIAIVEDLYGINLTVENGLLSDSLQIGSTWYGESLFRESVTSAGYYNYYYDTFRVYLSTLNQGFNLISQRGIWSFGFYLGVNADGSPQYILPLFKFGSTYFRTSVSLIPVDSDTSYITLAMHLNSSSSSAGKIGFSSFTGMGAFFPVTFNSLGGDSDVYTKYMLGWNTSNNDISVSVNNFYFLTYDSTGTNTGSYDAFGQQHIYNMLSDTGVKFHYDFSENPQDLFVATGLRNLSEERDFFSRFSVSDVQSLEYYNYSIDIYYNDSLLLDNYILNTNSVNPNGGKSTFTATMAYPYTSLDFFASRFAMITFFNSFGWSQLPATRNFSSYFLQINAEYLNGGGFGELIDSDSFDMLVVTDPSLYTNQNTAGNVVNVPSADDIINMSPDDSTINPDGGSSGSGDSGSTINPPDIPELDDSTIGDYLSSFVGSISRFFSWGFEFLSNIPQDISFPILGGFISMVCIGVVALII